MLAYKSELGYGTRSPFLHASETAAVSIKPVVRGAEQLVILIVLKLNKNRSSTV